MKNLTAFLIVALLAITACKKDQSKDKQDTADTSISSDSITAITKEAWIYGYPIFYNYKTIYASALNKKDRSYAGFNKLKALQ